MIRLPIAAIALVAPLALHAQALTPTEAARVDTIATRALAVTGTPSASIAIVRGGKLVFARAYGRASPSIPKARADLAYQIASNSKQFTAAALLMLQRDGKLSLDDHVARYLPGISGGGRITIRQLLSHTSGLQDYWPQDYSFAAMATPVTPQQIVNRWARKPLDFAPGAQWQYSNTGYVVAGLIVEKVTGEPLLTYLQRRVFGPLGMRAIDQDVAIGDGFPQGYQRFALGPVRPERPAAKGWLFAAGELAMSAGDLAKWDIARIDRTVLAPADWRQQEEPVRLNDGKTNGYGLGVQTGARDGHRYVEHTGEAVGFLSENIVFPDDKAAVVVLTNADFGDAFTTIAKGIVGMLLPDAQPGGTIESAEAAEAQRVFAMVQSGMLDRSLMTANANYYFTPTALSDYHASLAPLGKPDSFVLARPAELRGGFINRVYTVRYPRRTLSIVTYAEPGGKQRYEQFLVMPAE